MFSGAHVILYSKDAEADRAFLRDHLRLANVDAGDGWLIFKLPPAEIAIHPTDGEQRHELYFLCSDVEATLQQLTAARAEVSRSVSDQGWGLEAEVALPSGTKLSLYQPRHPVAHSLP